MSWQKFLPIPLVPLATAFLTWQVHSRMGDESVWCNGGDTCAIGSGRSWILTGLAMTAPLLIHLGWRWSARLDRKGKLDPLRRLVIPDYEEILEILTFLAAVAASWWIIRNGPKEALIDGVFPNIWFDRSLGTRHGGVGLVPSRGAWFAIGAIVGAPFSVALGAAAGREWFGFRRRRAEAAETRTARRPRRALVAAGRASSETPTEEPTELEEPLREISSDEEPAPRSSDEEE